MDELEISGKRYISTRRAGKEHAYHPDYIGQLIRGGKVPGQKVGRSWYVDARALSAYLKGEDVVSVSSEIHIPVMNTPKEITEELPEKKFQFAPESTIDVPTEIYLHPKILHTEVSSPISREEDEHPNHVPSKLRYIADEGPLFPIVQKQPVHQLQPAAPVHVHTTQLRTLPAERRKTNHSLVVGFIFLSGITALLAGVFVTAGTITNLVAGQGLAASTVSFDSSYLGSLADFVKP